MHSSLSGVNLAVMSAVACVAGQTRFDYHCSISKPQPVTWPSHPATRADALDGSPLAEGRYISGLLAACGDDLLPFVQLFHCLLDAAAAAGGGGGRTHLVSALAFGCPELLPRLWRCECALAHTSD